MTIAKYELLKKLSAKKPGPINPEVVTPSLVSPEVVSPDLTLQQQMTKEVRGTSYAQVAPSVTPQVVTPEAGVLKPDWRASVEHFGSQTVRRVKRPNPLTVRLSDQELIIIRGKAEAVYCTLNGYARAALLGSDYKPN